MPPPPGGDRAALEAADLRFVCVPKGSLEAVRREGLVLGDRTVYPTLREARAACGAGERVLVLEGGGAHVAPDAIANLTPFRRPKKIRAGGGLVLREGPAEPEVLLIFRRGAWDLPKGKRDPGETMPQCALREVREEVGIRRLGLLGEAGTTVHGYPEGDRYVVKRTYWYFMQTPERSFRPEAAEDIERVMWARWSDAVRRIGYDSLRQHLARLGPDAARAALARAKG